MPRLTIKRAPTDTLNVRAFIEAGLKAKITEMIRKATPVTFTQPLCMR
jgi:hypothetical protein